MLGPGRAARCLAVTFSAPRRMTRYAVQPLSVSAMPSARSCRLQSAMAGARKKESAEQVSNAP